VERRDRDRAELVELDRLLAISMAGDGVDLVRLAEGGATKRLGEGEGCMGVWCPACPRDGAAEAAALMIW
jgi:hypothetical protein